MGVSLNDRQHKIMLTEELFSAMELITDRALHEEGIPATAEVSLLLCDNAAIQAMNAQWRNKNMVTDVLSFPLLEEIGKWSELPGDELLLGDIVISTERAAEQAREYGHSLERELLYLFTHGLLHLLGYNHQEKQDKLDMRDREEKLLSYAGVCQNGP